MIGALLGELGSCCPAMEPPSSVKIIDMPVLTTSERPCQLRARIVAPANVWVHQATTAPNTGPRNETIQLR